MARQKNKICLSCDRVFRGRVDARACSERCRKRLQRARDLIETDASKLKTAAQEVVREVERAIEPAFASEGGYVGTTATIQPPLQTTPIPNPTPKLPTWEADIPAKPLSTPSPPPAAPISTPALEAAPLASPQATLPIAPSVPVEPPATSVPVRREPLVQSAAPAPPAPNPVATPPNTGISPSEHLNFSSNPLEVPTPSSIVTPVSSAATPAPTSTEPLVTTTDSLENPVPTIQTLTSTPSTTPTNLFTSQFTPPLSSNQSTTSFTTPASTPGSGFTSSSTSISSSTPPPPRSFRRPLLFAGAGIATLAILIGTGSFLLGNQSAQTKKNPTANITNTTDLANTTSSESIHFNRDTIIDGGHSLTVTGQVILQNSIDSTGALIVQNAEGADILIVDTLNRKVGINTAPNPNGASLQVSGDISINSIQVCTVLGCLATNAQTLQGFGAGYFTNASNISTGTIAQERLPINVAYTDRTNQIFTGTNTFNADVMVKTPVNSTTAFQVQNANGTSHLLIADTLNARIAIGLPSANYQLDVGGDINSTTGVRVAGNAICTAGGCVPNGGSGDYIQNSTGLQSANFAIQSAANTSVAALIRGASGQSADLLRLVSGDGGTNVFTVGATGDTKIQTAIDSATAFQVQMADTTTLLNVNTYGVGPAVLINSTGGHDIALDVQRVGASVLKVSGLDGYVRANEGSNQIELQTNTGVPAIYFGNLYDTNLYRSAADVLKTDDTFVAITALGVGVAPTSGRILQVQGSNSTEYASYLYNTSTNSAAKGLNVRIDQNTATNIALNVEIGAGNSVLNINGQGAVTSKNGTDSITAFQVQNAAGTNLFTIDTVGLKITLGPASSTPVILVLGNKNTSGDPTCTDGGIYYNSNSTQLRGCVNGAWNAIAGDNVVTSLPTTNLFDGKTVRLRVSTSPYDFEDLTYDATYAKWVSQVDGYQIAAGRGSNGSVSGASVYTDMGLIFMMTIPDDWYARYQAGLRPQFKNVFYAQPNTAGVGMKFRAKYSWLQATSSGPGGTVNGGDSETSGTTAGYYGVQSGWEQPAITPSSGYKILLTYDGYNVGTPTSNQYLLSVSTQVRWVSQ